MFVSGAVSMINMCYFDTERSARVLCSGHFLSIWMAFNILAGQRATIMRYVILSARKPSSRGYLRR